MTAHCASGRGMSVAMERRKVKNRQTFGNDDLDMVTRWTFVTDYGKTGHNAACVISRKDRSIS